MCIDIEQKVRKLSEEGEGRDDLEVEDDQYVSQLTLLDDERCHQKVNISNFDWSCAIDSSHRSTRVTLRMLLQRVNVLNQLYDLCGLHSAFWMHVTGCV